MNHSLNSIRSKNSRIVFTRCESDQSLHSSCPSNFLSVLSSGLKTPSSFHIRFLDSRQVLHSSSTCTIVSSSCPQAVQSPSPSCSTVCRHFASLATPRRKRFQSTSSRRLISPVLGRRMGSTSYRCRPSSSLSHRRCHASTAHSFNIVAVSFFVGRE